MWPPAFAVRRLGMRFIHLADVHLGAAPDPGMPWSKRREEEIWNTFRRIFEVIRREKADILFIAGDLFHRQPLMRELREVNYLFSTIPDTIVVLMAGNHDYLQKDSCYLRMEWAENVIFFRKPECTCVEIPRLKTFVYGLSYDRQEITDFRYHGIKPVDKPGFHVMLAHGGDAKHIPLRAEVLAGAGFDYIALGHIHKPQAMAGNKAVYAGALEPVDRNDTGAHGYVLGEWKDGALQVKLVPFASRSYIHQVLPVSEDATQMSLEDRLREEIEKQGKKNIYKVVLQGRRSPDMMIMTERFRRLGNVAEVTDETRPSYDLEQLLRRYDGTLIGEYIRHFMGRKLTAREEKALYYGLQALLETRG